MTTPIADKLRAARALVARGWTQGEYARDANNRHTGVNYGTDDGAPGHPVCWCAQGALLAGWDVDSYSDCLNLLAQVVGDPIVHRWNDDPGRTQAEVVAAFDKAIALAEQEEVARG